MNHGFKMYPELDKPTSTEIAIARGVLDALRRYGVSGVSNILHPSTRLILIDYPDFGKPIIVIG